VSCSFTVLAGENNTEILCENGCIIGNYGDLVSTMVPRPPGGIQLKWYLQDEAAWRASELPDIRNHGERLLGLAAPLAEFLHGRRPPIATAEEGREVLRMTLACHDSAREGRRIAFG
jgi:predicted dehydrogenase